MLELALITATLANVVTGDFTRYPAFIEPRGDGIETITDRGLIAEMIVRCWEPGDITILSYSKAEKLFCTPKDGCFKALALAREIACDP